LSASDTAQDDACIITDQLIDNALCGYRFEARLVPRTSQYLEDIRR
jgi:hypothetical protein